MCVNRCGCSNNMTTLNATMFSRSGNNDNWMIAQNGIGVDNLMYGHCYVPNQTMSTIFTAEQGLNHGTMFPELVSPYVPNQSLATINYLRNNNNGGCCR